MQERRTKKQEENSLGAAHDTMVFNSISCAKNILTLPVLYGDRITGLDHQDINILQSSQRLFHFLVFHLDQVVNPSTMIWLRQILFDIVLQKLHFFVRKVMITQTLAG